ncbi:hypothetical protein OF855_24730 [Mycolicibacterium fortuitum]|uniref:hypothetical protein n=1 Tax=Mycolicibacterium fortuitum TaxID=1766 RepID=UPI0022BA52FA|nr:hypothetical protein [Mycolicibacterium fortuitum]WAY18445.1 hypothetical protein OF855_24730 [Mycolicibacterium fortuitum]
MPNLQQLITEQKNLRNRSYSDYERMAGYVISRQRWQQLGTGARIKEFSEPATIKAMAEALQVDVAVVVLAMAKSLGLPIESGVAQSDLAVMLPPSARNLTAEQRDAVVRLVRVFAPEEDEHHADQPDDATDSPTQPDAQTEAVKVEEVNLPNDAQSRPVTMGDLMFGAKPTDDSVEQGKDGRDVAGGQ